MEKLLAHLIPDPMLDLGLDMQLTAVNTEQIISALSREKVQYINTEFDLGIQLFEQSALRDAFGRVYTVTYREERSASQYPDCAPRRQQYRDFSDCGVAVHELNYFYGQLCAGVVFHGSSDVDLDRPNYITARQARELYKLGVSGAVYDRLQYLCELALLREADDGFMRFASNVLLHFTASLGQMPLALKIALLAKNDVLAARCMGLLSWEVVAQIAIEQVSYMDCLGPVVRYYAQRQTSEFFATLLQNCQAQHAAQIFAFLNNEVQEAATVVRLTDMCALLIESDYETTRKPSQLQENAALLLMRFADAAWHLDSLRFCCVCGFALDGAYCARCTACFRLSDREFRLLIYYYYCYGQIEDIVPRIDGELAETGDLIFSETYLIGYAFRHIQAETVAAKIICIFILGANASAALSLLKEFGNLVARNPRAIDPKQVYAIFQLALESNSVQVSDQAMRFMIYILDSRDNAITEVIQLLLNSLIVVSVRKIDQVSAKSKVHQLGQFIKEIYHKSSVYCFINEDEIGLSLLLNLVGSAALQLGINFVFEREIDEAVAVQAMRFLQRKPNYVIEAVQAFIGFTLLGTLTDERILQVTPAYLQSAVDYLPAMLLLFSGGRSECIFLFNLMHTITYIARRTETQLRTLELLRTLMRSLAADSDTFLHSENIVKQLFCLLRAGDAPDQEFFKIALAAKNKLVRYSTLQLLCHFDSVHAERYRDQLLTSLRAVQPMIIYDFQKYHFQLAELFAVYQTNCDDVLTIEGVNMKVMPQFVVELYIEAQLTAEKAFYKAAKLVNVDSSASSAEYNYLLDYAKKQVYVLCQKVISGARCQEALEQMFTLKLALLDITAGFDLPYQSFRLLLPILLTSRNDAVLHYAKACCYQLIQRYGKAASWKEIFQFIYRYDNEQCDIGVLTWLFIFYECCVGEQIRKVFHIQNKRLMCQLVFVWFQGSFKGYDAVRQWLYENSFIKETWKVMYQALFERQANEMGDYLKRCGV